MKMRFVLTTAINFCLISTFIISDANVFVLRIRVSCEFSMRCTHVRFNVR